MRKYILKPSWCDTLRALPMSLRATLSMLFCTVMVTCPAWATVTIERDFNHVNLAMHVEYHVDSSNQLHYERIRQLPSEFWVRSEVGNLTFGFTDATHWFRFNVENRSDRPEELLLQMAYARFDSVEVMVRKTDGELTTYRSGKDHAFNDREIAHRHHLFPVNLDSNDSVEVYISGRTTGSFNFPLALWDKDKFYESDQVYLMIHGAYFGIWLLVIIFNVVLYSAIHHKALASFLGIVFSFGLYQLTTLGLGTTRFWGQYPEFYDATIVFSIVFALLSLGWLCDHLLELRENNPIGRRLLQALTYPALLAVGSYPIVGYGGVIPFLAGLTIPVSFVVLALGIHSAWQGNRMGIYSSIAWTALLIGIVTRAFNRFELLPNNFITEQALPTGFIMMILTLSFSIAAEYRRQSKQQQAALLAEHDQRAHEQQRVNEELEVMVSERTEELEGALRELSEVNETLREINTLDAVTGIKNRHYFDTVFEQEWRRSSREQYPVSVLLLDIDHFKRVNDTYGHLAGDECLRAVATTISTTLKRPADILARYGGEEFVAILPYIENDNAIEFADRIRKRVENSTYTADNHEINVTVSVGVCTVTPTEQDERKDAISAADIALYEAKNAGRNQVRNAGQLTVHTGNAAS